MADPFSNPANPSKENHSRDSKNESKTGGQFIPNFSFVGAIAQVVEAAFDVAHVHTVEEAKSLVSQMSEKAFSTKNIFIVLTIPLFLLSVHATLMSLFGILFTYWQPALGQFQIQFLSGLALTILTSATLYCVIKCLRKDS